MLLLIPVTRCMPSFQSTSNSFFDIYPLSANKSPEKFAAQCVEYFRIPVVHIPFCQAEVQQFATVIADQVELEAVKPSHGTFADLRHASEHSVGGNTLVMADGNLGGIYETYSGT